MRPPTGDVRLRDVTEDDLPIFYEHQRDPVANRMAAFPARDREAFMEHWTSRILGDDAALKRTILFDERVVGNILCFERDGETLVGYWIGREYWGNGIASRALSQFVDEVDARPLHAHVVKHNVGSLRVLEKCGFAVVREETIVECGETIEEVVLGLER